jgi:hypothetical protein
MKWRVSTHVRHNSLRKSTVGDITPEIPANNAMPGSAELFVKLFISDAINGEGTSFFMNAAMSWD